MPGKKRPTETYESDDGFVTNDDSYTNAEPKTKKAKKETKTTLLARHDHQQRTESMIKMLILLSFFWSTTKTPFKDINSSLFTT